MYPKVAIIILNWNGWKDTIECLESLFQITYLNYTVIVIDNGSKDDSIIQIKEWAAGQIQVNSMFVKYSKKEKPIKLLEFTKEEIEMGEGNVETIEDLPPNQYFIVIKNESNYGFAEGNNIGMRYALKVLKPDYILLLNNDIIVEKDFLNELVKIAESDENIGIVGAVNYYYDNPNKIWYSGGTMNWIKGKIIDITQNKIDNNQFPKIRNVDEVAGSSLLIKAEVIDKIGLLYSNYFYFFEETEWCAKAKKKGYSIYANLNAKIWHKVSVSVKRSGFEEYYLTRNRFIFMRRNSKRLQFLSFLIYFFVIDFIITVGYFLRMKESIETLKAYYAGINDGIRFVLKKDFVKRAL